MKSLLIFLAVMFAACQVTAADPQVNADLRNGQAMERAGDQAGALALYEKAFSAQPENLTAFSLLKNAYVRAKLYDKLIAACEVALESRPQDVSIYMALGEAWASKGDKKQAKEAWNKILELDPRSRGNYVLVGYELTRYNMNEEVVELYEMAEKALNQEYGFASELSRAYEAVGNHEKAADEILNVLYTKPKDTVQVERELKKLMSYTDRSAILQLVKSRAKKDPGWTIVHRILGDLYLMENDYSQALKEYALTGTDEPLWELAQKAEDEGLYDAALNSYENLASGKGKYSSAAAYRIGVVLAAETKYEKSIEAFNKFIRDFPADSNVPSAKYGVGTVYAEGLSDPAAALPYFSELASRGRPEGIGLDSKVMVADCDVRLGNLRQAALDIEPVLQSDESGRSLFLLAEILYFQGDFDSALVVYNKIPDQMPNSDYANDALSRSLLLSAHANAKKELQRMANAERMMYAREYDSAIKESRSLMAAEPASDLADDCVLLIGEALEGKKSYNEAVAAYRDLIKVYPESRLKPEAQRRIGELFADRLNDKKAAIEELEQLLVNYPDYVLAGAVRNRIEELKGGEHQ